MDVGERRDLYNGFGEGLQRAVEFAVTPALFGLAGYGLDRWLGTLPLFTILLALFAVIGSFVRVWIHYDAEMRHQEQVLGERRRVRRTPVGEVS